MALKDYLVLIDLDSNDVDAHFHLALLFARDKKWNDAQLHFGRAIEIRPKAAWILQGYANALIRANKLAEAEPLLIEAENANPYHSPTLVDFGRLYERRGDRRTAEDYYRQAVEVDPNNSFAYYTLAQLLYHEGETTEAYECAKAAIATKPLDARNKALVEELKKKLEGPVSS